LSIKSFSISLWSDLSTNKKGFIKVRTTTNPPSNTTSYVVKNTLLFGAKSFVATAGYYGLMKLMSSLGRDQGAASSVIATLQGVTIAAGVGLVTSVGSEVSSALGKKLGDRTISAILKTGLIECIALGSIGSLVCLSTKLWMPLVLSNHRVASHVVNYMLGYCGAPLAEFLMAYAQQVVFKMEDNSWFGLIFSTIYRGLCIPLAYFLSVRCDMGMTGIGIACTFIGILSSILTLGWFVFRNTYRKLDNLFTYHFDNFWHMLKQILMSGGKFALQRLTEWGNLYIIVQIIGALYGGDLLSIQPSVVAMLFAGQLTQGFSLAGMMISTQNTKALCATIAKIDELDKRFVENGDLIQFPNAQNRRTLLEQAHNQMKTVKWNLYTIHGAGLLFNFLLVGVLFIGRNVFVDWTLPANIPINSSQSLRKKAMNYLELNLLGTFPDTIRVISGNALNAWDDISFSIFSSLILMSVVGIPLGLLFCAVNDNNIGFFFLLRMITLTIAAFTNIARNYSNFNNCSTKLMQLSAAESSDETYEEINQSSSNLGSRDRIFKLPNAIPMIDANATLLTPLLRKPHSCVIL